MSGNSSTSFLLFFHHCSDAEVGFFIVVAFNVARFFLLLPLSLIILYLGHRQWQQHGSFATTSHSDIFTYHSAAMELIYALGAIFYLCGKYTGFSRVMKIGYCLCYVVLPGQTSFHILTCVERYLAVVHPVIYLGLRRSGGLRIRNISIGCVWLLCCGWIGVTVFYFPGFPYIPIFCLLVFSLVVVSYCSLSVVCVLIRPGPGETCGNTEWVDQSKRRAFITITAITAVLWLFFIGLLVCVALDNSHLLSYNNGCIVLKFGYWFTLPSSLVLPLLFLHRAGKLCCCSCSND